jgi:hypothetical protein
MFISNGEKRINNIAFPIILISSFVTITLTELNHGTNCSNANGTDYNTIITTQINRFILQQLPNDRNAFHPYALIDRSSVIVISCI